MNIIVRNNEGASFALTGETFQHDLAQGRLWNEIATSVDGGKTWAPAWQVDMRLKARGDDGLAMLMPIRTEAWSTIAGYLALFSLLFFGGPISCVLAMLAFDSGPKKILRLAFVLGAFVVGPIPIAFPAELGRRALLRDPTLRGKGRMIFAFIVAGTLMVPCSIGLVGALLR